MTNGCSCGHIDYWHFSDGCHNKSNGKKCECKNDLGLPYPTFERKRDEI